MDQFDALQFAAPNLRTCFPARFGLLCGLSETAPLSFSSRGWKSPGAHFSDLLFVGDVRCRYSTLLSRGGLSSLVLLPDSSSHFPPRFIRRSQPPPACLLMIRAEQVWIKSQTCSSNCACTDSRRRIFCSWLSVAAVSSSSPTAPSHGSTCGCSWTPRASPLHHPRAPRTVEALGLEEALVGACCATPPCPYGGDSPAAPVTLRHSWAPLPLSAHN